MKRTALIVAALTASSVMAQSNTCGLDSSYGDLLKAVSTSALVVGDITVAGNTAAIAATAAGAKCGYTVGDLICATEAKLVLAVQQYINDVKEDLATAAGTRDEFILAQRGEVIKVFDSVRQLNALKDADIPDAYALVAGSFIGYAEEIASDFSAIVENFDTYQTARATCFDALLQSQAVLLCNAALDVEPTGMDRTVGSEATTYDDAFVTQLSAACYNYIQHSATQSSILLTAVYASGLSSLAAGLQNIADGDATAAAENLTAAFAAFIKVTESTTNAEKPVAVPTSCTSQATCITWLDSLFDADGILDQNTAILGGDVVALTFTSSRVMKEGNERRLAAGGVVADIADYTFTTAFEKNPADVDNTENANSALRNGVTACAVAALALLF